MPFPSILALVVVGLMKGHAVSCGGDGGGVGLPWGCGGCR